jgi:hypothetical protein
MHTYRTHVINYIEFYLKGFSLQEKKGLTCTGKWDLEKAYLLKREPEWWDDVLEMNY